MDKHPIGTCRTCQHWNQKYPNNTSLGACQALGVHVIDPQAELSDDKMQTDVAIIMGQWGMPPSSEVLDVRTLANFGCVMHQSKFPL